MFGKKLDADARLDKLVKNLVAIATEHTKLTDQMTADEAFAFIKRLVATNDVIFGVWADGKSAGTATIKGDALLREALASPEPTKLKVSAIQCTREQAVPFGATGTSTENLGTGITAHSAKWNALVRYDPELRAAADQLRGYGGTWVARLGRDFFALGEDRKYLPNMVDKLREEAAAQCVQAQNEIEEFITQVVAWHWAERFRVLNDGMFCSPQSLEVLRRAEQRGYKFTVDDGNTIVATKEGATSYLRSDRDIQWWGSALG